MVLEHAVLNVTPGQEEAFEAAFATARSLISSARGFRSLRLARGVEVPNRYVLLVEWDTLEAHTTGFRGSSAYEEWRSLLHHFYDPFPVVEHYQDLVTMPERRP